MKIIGRGSVLKKFYADFRLVTQVVDFSGNTCMPRVHADSPTDE